MPTTLHDSDASTEGEIVRRIQACKTYHEWLEVMRSLPPEEDGYDIVKALAENRRWSGEPPLLPAEDRQP